MAMMTGAALSVLFAGAAAIHVATERGNPTGGGPRVMVTHRSGRVMSANVPQARVFVYGADTDDVQRTPRYHNIAKTGITSVENLLRAAINDPYSWQRVDAFAPAFQREPADFVIATVRNPCNYYVSLWAYAAEHSNAHISKELAGEGRRFLDQLSSRKNSDSDIQKFRDFVRFIQGDIGVLTGRLAYGYLPGIYAGEQGTNFSTRWLAKAKSDRVRELLNELNTSQVDCWVSTETLPQDMVACMGMLANEDYGLSINWTRFNSTLASLTQNPSEHEPCKTYYDKATEQFVREKDSVVFRKFGFDTCCDAGSKLATHLASHEPA